MYASQGYRVLDLGWGKGATVMFICSSRSEGPFHRLEQKDLKVTPVPLPRSNTLYPWEAYIGMMVGLFIARVQLRILLMATMPKRRS